MHSGRSDWFGISESIWPVRAELAIRSALSSFAIKAPTVEQLGDLADAIEAYRDKSFYVAMVLAEGCTRKRVMERGRRPKLNKTLSELRESFVDHRRRARAIPGDDLQ